MDAASLANLIPWTQETAPKSPGRTNPAKRAAGEACWKGLLADFLVNGIDAIVAFRTANPGGYVQLVASGLPAETKIEATIHTGPLLTLAQAADMAESIIESSRRSTAGASGTDPVRDSEPTGLPAGVVALHDS